MVEMRSGVAERRVLVTGAATGIGLAIARAFVAAGAHVHICDVDPVTLADAVRELPGIETSRTDVGAPEDVARLFDRIDADWGGIDILVNNAGVGGPRGLIEEIDLAEWRRCSDVNLHGAFYCMKGAIPSMKRAGHGRLINIITSSVRTGLPGRSAYVASKGGMMSLSFNAARELGPFGITSNAILPGMIDNPRGRALIANFGKERGLPDEEALETFLQFVSTRSLIDPREVADMAVFLASDAARNITGQNIGVCGNVEWEA